MSILLRLDQKLKIDGGETGVGARVGNVLERKVGMFLGVSVTLICKGDYSRENFTGRKTGKISHNENILSDS